MYHWYRGIYIYILEQLPSSLVGGGGAGEGGCWLEAIADLWCVCSIEDILASLAYSYQGGGGEGVISRIIFYLPCV